MSTNLDRRRWLILAASCIMNIFGGSFYAWSVFAGPLAVRIGGLTGAVLTAADLAPVFTVTTALFPFPMIIGGYINDRFGPRWVVFGCGILFAMAMVLSGLATSVAMLTVTYGVMISVASGMVYTCAVGNTVKFFPDHRGLASGLTTGFNGLGAVIFPLVASALGVDSRLSQVMILLGVVCGSIIVLCSFFLTKCPVGYLPAGYTPRVSVRANTPSDKDWHQMLRDHVFFLMLAILLCGAFVGLLTTSQASPIAQNMVGMTAEAAAVAVSELALCNACGRLLAGMVSDRLGRENTLALVFLLAMGGMVLLCFTGEGQVLRLYESLSVIGVCFGAVMGIFPGFTADRFGTRYNSLNYSIMFMGYSLAGLAAPLLMSRIYRTTGHYRPSFLLAMAMAALGLGLTLVYRHIHKHEHH